MNRPMNLSDLLFSPAHTVFPHRPLCNRICMTAAAIVTIFGAAMVSTILATNQIAAKVTGQNEVIIEDLKWATLPFVGAMLAGLMAFVFRPDDWRKTFGRFIGAAVVGVAVPRIATYMHPWLKDFSLDPIILILGGFICGLVGYALAKWSVDWALQRAPTIAEVQAEQWVQRQEKRKEERIKEIINEDTQKLER